LQEKNAQKIKKHVFLSTKSYIERAIFKKQKRHLEGRRFTIEKSNHVSEITYK